ncbi:hypothetical protein Tco_1169878 [Tanacetum coccineum]
MEVSTLEARHQLPVSSEDSDETNLLHLGLGRGRRAVYSIGWEENNKAHLHVLTAATRVPTRREPRRNQGSIIAGTHRPEELADIQSVKTAGEVTGNPNQRGTVRLVYKNSQENGQNRTKLEHEDGRVQRKTGEIDNSRIKEQEGMVKNVTSRHLIGQEKQRQGPWVIESTLGGSFYTESTHRSNTMCLNHGLPRWQSV